MSQRTVNERQLDVLRWVVEGCPARDWPDATYKTVAVALQNRRLVRLARKGGVWTATATDAGRYFAKHGTYPYGHWTEQPQTKSRKTGPQSASSHRAKQAKPSASVVTIPVSGIRRRGVGARRPAEHFADDVLAAMSDPTNTWGGLMVDEADRSYYAGLVRSAERYGTTPEGKQWVQERVLDQSDTQPGARKTVWRLVDLPDWITLQPGPLPVADSLTTDSHPAVRAMETEETVLPFAQPTRNRALHLLDALARAAEQKGYLVESIRHGHRHDSEGAVLLFTLRQHAYGVRVVELVARATPVQTEVESGREERTFGVPIAAAEPVGPSRLQIEILGYSLHPAKFADTKWQTLEERLPHVLHALELRAVDAEAARIKREDEEAVERPRWEEIHASAVAEYVATARARVLTDQAERFAGVRKIDDYLAALQLHLDSLADPDQVAAAREWHAWASAYRASIDPFAQPVGMPSVDEPTPDDLKPYMRDSIRAAATEA